jgi:hypothetical protein
VVKRLSCSTGHEVAANDHESFKPQMLSILGGRSLWKA